MYYGDLVLTGCVCGIYTDGLMYTLVGTPCNATPVGIPCKVVLWGTSRVYISISMGLYLCISVYLLVCISGSLYIY